MKTAFFTAVLLCVASVSLAQTNPPDDEHPYQTLEALGAAHEIVSDIDRSSFEEAVAYYPHLGRDGYHTIAIGKYMMWKIVNLFATTDRVDEMRLEDFSELCRVRLGFADSPEVDCDLYARLIVTDDDETHRFEFRQQNVQMGAHFDTGDPRYAPARRAEMRRLVDRAIEHFEARMREEGILGE